MTPNTSTIHEHARRLMCFQVEGDGCDASDIEIIFARSSIEAKRRWSNEHWNGDNIAGISAKRCKGWDKHAPGPVPALELIEAGWWFECHGCGRQINSDDIGHPITNEDDEDCAVCKGSGVTRDEAGGLQYESECAACASTGKESGRHARIMQPVELPSQRVWCSAECRDRDLAERAKIKRWENRIVAWMGRRVIKRFPDAVLIPFRDSTISTHCYVGRDAGLWTCKQVIVAFKWPGQKIGPASLRIDSEYRSSGQWRRKPRRAEWSCCNGDREAFEAYAKISRCGAAA